MLLGLGLSNPSLSEAGPQVPRVEIQYSPMIILRTSSFKLQDSRIERRDELVHGDEATRVVEVKYRPPGARCSEETGGMFAGI